MSVKSNIVSPGQTSTFPKLMRSKTSPLVVLFTEASSGTVVVSTDRYTVGHYCEDWCADSFEPFSDRVVLENS